MAKEKKFSSVFIVEEVELLSTMFDLALAQEDIFTFTHPNPDCLHFIKDLEPDVLLLDMETIHRDKDQFFSGIKKIGGSKPLHILGIGNPGQQDLIGQHAEILKGYIEKPVSPTQVYSLIEKFI